MRFHRLGLDFSYPDSWTVETDDDSEPTAAVTVYAPEGGFWSVSRHAPDGRAAAVAEAVVEQFRGEYRDLDAEPAADDVAGLSLAGFDLNFYCLDLTNTARAAPSSRPGPCGCFCARPRTASGTASPPCSPP